MPNFNSIGSGVLEPQVAENHYLLLTGSIALTTLYALTCYTVILGLVVSKTRWAAHWRPVFSVNMLL